MKHVLFVILACGLSISCRPRTESGLASSNQGHLTEQNLEDHMVRPQGQTGYDGYVKFSVLVNNGALGTIYFHSKSFEFHGDFLKTLPQFSGLSREQIDLVALKTPQRKVLLGNIFLKQIQHAGAWGYSADIQLLSNDVIEADKVGRIFTHIKPSVRLTSAFQYLPDSAQEQYVKANTDVFTQLGIDLASLAKDDRSKQCYSLGWTVGRIKIMTEAEAVDATKRGLLTPEDILVVDRAPRELPLLGGVITGAVTALSSHVALMSQMTGSPFFYLKDAPTLQSIRDLAASQDYVFLRAQGQLGGDCTYDFVSQREFGEQWLTPLLKAKRPKPLALPLPSIQATRPIDLVTASSVSADTIGAKAANVWRLMKLVPESTVKEAIALPFGTFSQYLKTATLADGTKLTLKVLPLLTAIDASNDLVDIAAKLKEVRSAIKDAQMVAAQKDNLLTAINARWTSGTRIRARSSSNVEDGEHFNGAGLYESKGVCVGDDVSMQAISVCDAQDQRDPVIDGVKGVWASLFTIKAHIARRHYGISYTRAVAGSTRLNAMMGVLIHESFVAEKANGVAISKKSEFSDSIGVISTGFPGEEFSVTNPEPGKVPEIASLNEWGNSIQVSTSELPISRTVMTNAQYEKLRLLIDKVHRFYLEQNPGNKSLSLDFEWKVTAADTVLLKQVRPVPTGVNPQSPLPKSIVLAQKGIKLCPNLRAESGRVLRKLFLAREYALDWNSFEMPDTSGPMANPGIKLTAMEPELSSSTESFRLAAPANINATITQDASSPAKFSQLKVPLIGTNELQISEMTFSHYGRKTMGGEVRLASDLGFLIVTKAKVPCHDGDCTSFDDQGQIVEGVGGDFIAVKGESCETAQGIPDATHVVEASREIHGTINYPVTMQYTAFHNGGCGGIGAGCTFYALLRQYRIKGILDRELTISGPYNAHFSNSHHGAGEVAVDLYRALGLTAGERQQLQAKKARYLVYPVANDDPADTSMTGKAGLYSELFEKSILGRIEQSF